MQTKYNDRTLLRFYWSLIVRHKFKCLTMSIFGILWGITEAVTPYGLKLVIDLMTQYNGSRELVGEVFFWPITGLIALVAGQHIILRITDILTSGYIVPQIRINIRTEMLSYAIGHSYYYFQKKLAGSLGQRISVVADSFRDIYEAWEHWIFPVICSFSISLFVLYLTHPYCALLFASWLVLSLIISAFLAVKSLPYSRAASRAKYRSFGVLVNILQNVFTVKQFARKHYELSYFQNYQDEEYEKYYKLEWFMVTAKSILSLSCIGLFAGIIFFLLDGWKMGRLSVGDVTFVITTSFSMMKQIWWFSKHIQKMLKRYGFASQAFQIMQRNYEVRDLSRAKRLDVKQGGGAISFNNISFGYKEKEILFKNLSVSIKAGEKIGLVGFSGSGKSSFIHLILRFFDLNSGTITIDDHDISRIKQDSLRELIALIPQEPLMFARTIRENVLYGSPKATEKEMIKACKRAHAHDFIKELPNGYDTIAGERGASLSGGQRQRIAIARAILKNAPILILDEATSALDSVTEKKIQESVDAIMQDKTTIVIAHRLSTLKNMDRILVFDEGKVVEEGAHSSLVRKKGYYASMWNMQIGGFLPENKPDAFESEDEEEHSDTELEELADE